MTRRAYLTEREKERLLDKQYGLCAVCGSDFLPNYNEPEFDHWLPVALGNDGKPDTALCKFCHKNKTRLDVKAIAKVRRIQKKAAGQSKPKRKITSRGFDRRYRKRLNGTVERVAA